MKITHKNLPVIYPGYFLGTREQLAWTEIIKRSLSSF